MKYKETVLGWLDIFMNPKGKILFLIIICILFTVKFEAQNKTTESLGDVLLFALPASTLAATFIIGDKEGSWQFTKGFILNEVMTFGLKSLINKPRPDLSNNNSFPSGHTSSTFQSASFIQKRYGWKYGIPAYALAGFTAYTRIDAKKHDGWDILAGAVIGISSTYIFTTPYQKEHFEMSFRSNDNEYMVGFTYKF